MRGYGSTLGLYRPGSGFLYRTPLPVKAVAALACTVVVVAWRSPATSAVALVLTLGALTLGARCSPARVLRMLLPAAPVLGILALYQGLFQGWPQAFAVVGGIAACLLAARAVTLTTPLQDLLDGVARLARPFRVVGADPERFALALSIMLRSIPYLAGLFVDVRDAARARGLDRNPRVAVTPLVVGAVAYAHRTGEALAARGLGDAEEDGRQGR
ncbi:energy-coupling factor transporter transmembrane component T family protein [Arthrobacter agilis]|uniref:energy-coupling factor transporter transmembrane component T family protein n=1 Tax=Arthrobacter agilis TaxID=37921 RepID=UPI0027867AB2|nr:energy-coupling factor transporter transmembrane protein EcfT [Arthrobacter agilis]MDQ0734620.1 biotin transport system permease protein [Arthrobacter agilis]